MRLPLQEKYLSSIARHVANRIGYDLDIPAQLEARDQSARFVATNMQNSYKLTNRRAMITHACMQAAELQGCFCEFGVYRGESLRLIAKRIPKRVVHGFDSFEGLPQDWRHGFGASSFKTAVPRFSQRNIHLHVGLFEDTVPKFVDSLSEDIAFVHIDCDIYSSTRTVLDLIIPRLKSGAVLLFDEYFNYPGWEEHEHKAWTESMQLNGRTFQYAAYNRVGEQVMVIIT